MTDSTTEALTQRLDDVPPVLYVPCAEAVADPAQARIEYRTTLDGRVAVLAYTALDRLVQGCGDAQPWVLLPTARFSDMARVHPYDVVLVDIEMPEELKRRSAGAMA